MRWGGALFWQVLVLAAEWEHRQAFLAHLRQELSLTKQWPPYCTSTPVIQSDPRDLQLGRRRSRVQHVPTSRVARLTIECWSLSGYQYL